MATKKPAKKATKKVEGINSRTGKLMKGYKYQNGKVVKVKTATQKAKQTGTTHVKEDKMHKAPLPRESFRVVLLNKLDSTITI